jgi:hypothetical protein
MDLPELLFVIHQSNYNNNSKQKKSGPIELMVQNSTPSGFEISFGTINNAISSITFCRNSNATRKMRNDFPTKPRQPISNAFLFTFCHARFHWTGKFADNGVFGSFDIVTMSGMSIF